MNKTLSVLKSKTLWFATIVTGTGFLQAVQPFIPAQYMPLVVAGIGVVSAGLRFATSKPVSEK